MQARMKAAAGAASGKRKGFYLLLTDVLQREYIPGNQLGQVRLLIALDSTQQQDQQRHPWEDDDVLAYCAKAALCFWHDHRKT